jgi:hypothetical protein
LFKALLTLSFTTGIVSVITYPYNMRASLVLAFASALAQLVATLLLIEDSGNTIMVATDEIHMLEEELMRRPR